MWMIDNVWWWLPLLVATVTLYAWFTDPDR